MLTPIIGYFEMLAPIIAGNHYCEDVLDRHKFQIFSFYNNTVLSKNISGARNNSRLLDIAVFKVTHESVLQQLAIIFLLSS